MPIIAGRNEALPHIILDSDTPGRNIETQLKSSLYSGSHDRIIMMADVCAVADAEVEDLFPIEYLAYVATRILRGPEEEFSDFVQSGIAFVSQIEAYAKKHILRLDDGWKVEIAKRAKERLLQRPTLMDTHSELVNRWQQLFERIST